MKSCVYILSVFNKFHVFDDFDTLNGSSTQQLSGIRELFRESVLGLLSNAPSNRGESETFL